MGAVLFRRLRREGAYHLRCGCGLPVYMAVTAANVNDITAAQAMPIEAGASCVFDLGYYDYGIKARYRTPRYLSAWAKLDVADAGS